MSWWSVRSRAVMSRSRSPPVTRARDRRNLVALAPTKIGLTHFDSFQDTTDPAGTPARDLDLLPRASGREDPGEGFASCRDDAPFSRVVETFNIEIRRPPVSEYRGEMVAGRVLRCEGGRFQRSNPVARRCTMRRWRIRSFPTTGDRPRWAIFIGIVRWVKAVNQSGRLVTRIDDDLNATRRGPSLSRCGRRDHSRARRRAAVARSHARSRRQHAQFPAADPQTRSGGVPRRTTIWSGSRAALRVIGDARLVAGKLDYRVERGGNDGVPMWLRRVKDTSTPRAKSRSKPPSVRRYCPTRKPDSPSVPSAPAAGVSIERLTVITDGRVGVNTPDPTNSPPVSGTTGHSSGLRLRRPATMDGPASRSTPISRRGTSGSFLTRRRLRRGWLDETGGVPAIRMMTNLVADPAKWDLRVSSRATPVMSASEKQIQADCCISPEVFRALSNSSLQPRISSMTVAPTSSSW